MKQSDENHLVFNQIIDLLHQKNHHVNLSGIKEKSAMYEQHILDSKFISEYIKNTSEPDAYIMDLGSGAGFPGLVIAIENPNKNVILVDSNNKKINFIKMVVSELKLKNITTLHQRIEKIGCPENADAVCAKALAPLDILLEYAYPLLKPQGILVAMKSCDISEERESADIVANLLGFKAIEDKPYSLSDKQRQLVVFKKVGKAQISLPRKTGEATHNPLRSKLCA